MPLDMYSKKCQNSILGDTTFHGCKIYDCIAIAAIVHRCSYHILLANLLGKNIQLVPNLPSLLVTSASLVKNKLTTAKYV